MPTLVVTSQNMHMRILNRHVLLSVQDIEEVHGGAIWIVLALPLRITLMTATKIDAIGMVRITEVSIIRSMILRHQRRVNSMLPVLRGLFVLDELVWIHQIVLLSSARD